MSFPFISFTPSCTCCAIRLRKKTLMPVACDVEKVFETSHSRAGRRGP